MAGILGKVDAKFAEILSDWNTATSVLLGLILIQILYPLFFSSDPDTHPMLLARQASFSPVRQKGQSATYRSNETPYGYPLKAGLNVKDPSMPKYVSGKDGDLRDVWRQAVRGVEGQNQRGALMTVLGSKQIIEHDLEEVSREINIIGHHLQEQRARRVAVYLPNSVELLSTVFAASFYGFTVILIPYKQQHDPVIDLLRQTNADTLVVAAGSLPLAEVAQKYKGLDQVVWVVEKTSRHVDWSEVPEGVGGSIAVSVWHDLVEDQKHVHGNDIPENGDTEPGNVVTVWQAQGGSLISVVEFSHKHLVAAIAAQISALPIRQRISHEDLFLPADSLTNSYTLTLTLAALFSNASVAVTSVAGPGVDLFLASRSVKPTIVVSSVESAQKLQANGTASLTGAMKQVIHWQQTRQILSSGSMPPHTPGKLRLLFISSRAAPGEPRLSSTQLSDLRIFTGARILYALTAAKVAGAVCQTNPFDYRTDDGPAHFGIPLSSVEVRVAGQEGDVSQREPRGEIIVSGTAVAGGEAALGIQGMFREDSTLALV